MTEERDALGRVNSGKKGKKYQRMAYEWLKEQGYEDKHFVNKDPRKSHPFRFGGWPDYVIQKDNESTFHFYEIKSGTHKLDPHQQRVLEMLSEIGVVHILTYEGDILIDEEIW